MRDARDGEGTGAGDRKEVRWWRSNMQERRRRAHLGLVLLNRTLELRGRPRQLGALRCPAPFTDVAAGTSAGGARFRALATRGLSCLLRTLLRHPLDLRFQRLELIEDGLQLVRMERVDDRIDGRHDERAAPRTILEK